jgi:hypothetical protein
MREGAWRFDTRRKQMVAIYNKGLDPAFPPHGGSSQQGITIRDYFASVVLSGLVTAHAREVEAKGPELVAQAYALADVMIKARV